MVSQIENALLNVRPLGLKLSNGKVIEIFPHRLVHLEGALSLVGEDILDRCVVFFRLSHLAEVYDLHERGDKPHFSALEVDDFINGFRSINGSEVRLIVKVHGPDQVNLTPLYHYLGKPYLITNSEGDHIWAANVEPCKDLMNWLWEMGNQVEILDPTPFKEEFQQYCRTRRRKKAS